jgi:outer membrane protein OmpA-like peptidoglycan-associated protein
MRRRSTFVAVTAAGLLLSGCATKDWVRDMMGKQASETDSKLGEQKIRVEGMGFRMAKVEEQATKAGERADAAHARAEAAHVRADGVDERLTRLWSSRHKRQDVESMDVTFGFDRWELDDGAQTTLLGFIKELQANPNLTVDLTGYTDPTGGVPYNIGLSQRRVEAVRRFLVSKGVALPRIQAIGLGVLDDGALTDAQKRRVTVRLMTPTE